MVRNEGNGSVGFFQACPTVKFFPSMGHLEPSSITYWEKPHMRSDSPLTARLPTPGIWCFFFKTISSENICNVLSAELIYHSYHLSFCPLTVDLKSLLWFTEVVLDGFSWISDSSFCRSQSTIGEVMLLGKSGAAFHVCQKLLVITSTGDAQLPQD